VRLSVFACLRGPVQPSTSSWEVTSLVARGSPLFRGRVMLYRVAQSLRFPFAGALLVCVALYLLSGFLPPPSPLCCGDNMGFPFLCLGIIFCLFGLIALVSCSARQPRDSTRSPAASNRLFRCLADLVFSDHLRGGFFVALLLSTALVLSGAGLLFSLSLRFTWSALALGCLSMLSGLGIPFLDGHHPDS